MILDELQQYLKRLGVDFEIKSQSAEVRGLPLFVAASNDWVLTRFAGLPLTLAVTKRNGLSPQDVVTQWKAIRQCTQQPCAMVLRPEGEAYCRILDKARVDYLMPRVRLHVVGKAMLVTGQVAKTGYVPKDRMTCAGQQIVLYHLLRETTNRTPLSNIVTGLSMNKAQASLAARELERLNICTIDRAWKSHSLVWANDRRDVWNRALPRLATPVQRRVRVTRVPQGLLVAGIEALSQLSLLASDKNRSFALSRWDSRVKTLPVSEYEGDWVEIWKYDPKLFAGGASHVDPLSLYLSLKDDGDPRIQGELKNMLEEYKW